MYLKIKLNKLKLSNHFRYFVWIYVCVAIAAGTLLNIAVTISKNQAAPHEKLYSFICGDTLQATYFHIFLEEMTEAFPDMKLVSLENLAYNEQGMMATEYKKKFFTYTSSKYGDVMILPYSEFADLAAYGYFEPLDDDFAEYIDDVDPVSLKTVKMHLPDNDRAYVYGIPLSHLDFFPAVYDTSDKVLVLMSYSQNKDNAKRLVKWYLDYMIETDWNMGN